MDGGLSSSESFVGDSGLKPGAILLCLAAFLHRTIPSVSVFNEVSMLDLDFVV